MIRDQKFDLPFFEFTFLSRWTSEVERWTLSLSLKFKVAACCMPAGDNFPPRLRVPVSGSPGVRAQTSNFILWLLDTDSEFFSGFPPARVG